MKRKTDKTKELVKEALLFAIEDQKYSLLAHTKSIAETEIICKNIKTLAEAFAIVDGE